MSKPARRVLELLVLLYRLLPMKLEGYDSRYQYAVPVPVPYEYEKVPTGTMVLIQYVQVLGPLTRY